MATGQTSGTSSALNVTAATAVKDRSGTVGTIIVNATVTGAVTVHDQPTTGSPGASTLVYTSAANPAAGTVIVLNFPCRRGIMVTPGSAGTVAVSYE